MNSDAPHRFFHEAMATTFEVRIAGQPADYARQAADACFALLDRLEDQLSRFRESSDIACINRLGPGEVLRITADTAACLALAFEINAITGGAFDAGLGREMDLRRTGADSTAPGPTVRGRLHLDSAGLAVQVLDAPVSLDLGAIGKGYALDRMADLLGEWGVERALLVGGSSSLRALDGLAPDLAWEIGVGATTLPLCRLAAGASGTGVQGEHILDPLTGGPARGAARAWAFADSAACADALSTAFMVLAAEEVAEVCRLRPEIGAVLQPAHSAPDLVSFGQVPAWPK